jgi:hypothetical protein
MNKHKIRVLISVLVNTIQKDRDSWIDDKETHVNNANWYIETLEKIRKEVK